MRIKQMHPFYKKIKFMIIKKNRIKCTQASEIRKICQNYKKPIIKNNKKSIGFKIIKMENFQKYMSYTMLMRKIV